MSTAPKICVCCLITALSMSGCTKDPAAEAKTVSTPDAAKTPATPSPTAAPAAQPTKRPDTPVATKPAQTPGRPAPTAPGADAEVDPDVALNTSIDKLQKRLEALTMASGFINDEGLNDLIAQFREKMDETAAQMKAMTTASDAEKVPLRAKAQELVAEMQKLDVEVNNVVRKLAK